MTNRIDTIAAIATPPGRGGVGVIRVSGPQAFSIAQAILGHTPTVRFAKYTPFLNDDNSIIDEGIALYFSNPNSFTGEDVLELQGHGGPVILDCVLQRVLRLGARLAKPGEFSERAFLNEKLDLTQAEAVADLIDAASTEAAQAAMRSLQGEFSKRIHQLVELLIHLRMYVEAAMDFAEEEIDFLSDGTVAEKLAIILQELANVLIAAKQGSLLQEGMTVVIAGKPNAGKSSLLNALSGRDTAIVTAVPGTTRDVLREVIQIDGLPLHIVDTAGLRDSTDQVEQEGIRRARIEIDKADRILLVVDCSVMPQLDYKQLEIEFLQTIPIKKQVTVVLNKIDLINNKSSITEIEGITTIGLSAQTGEGIHLLREHLKTCMGYQANLEGCFIARRRHLDALLQAQSALLNGQQHLQTHRAGEILAEELRLAQQSLNEITGEFTTDDLLGRIFSNFCVGK